MLSSKQTDFFNTFGFIKFAGMLKDDIAAITDEFEKVFPMYPNLKHDGTKRSLIVPFIDQRERLSALLDDPRIYEICVSLVGKDFNYMGSDGNYYVGHTGWHPDGQNRKRRHIKIAFYLDELNGSNGALRVIPGSHRLGDRYSQDVAEKVMKSEEVWGLHGSEVPAQVLDVVPGDVLVFDHSTFHSSWGGSNRRRMFTMNLSQRFADDDLEELKNYIVMHAHYGRSRYYGDAMINTASPQRMKHLEQVMSVDDDFREKTAHLKQVGIAQ